MAEFSWAAAADTGGGLLGGLTKGLNAMGANDVAKANAYASNENRVSKDLVNRSQAGLAAAITSINNQRIQDNAAHVQGVMTENALRTQDAIANGDFQASIKGAEIAGQAGAKAAMLGIGGASVAAASQTTQLQINQVQQQRDDQNGELSYDQMTSLTGIEANALRQTNTNPINLGQDLNVTQSPSTPNLADYLIQGLTGKAGSAQTLLGSMYDQTQPGAGPPAAVATPVGQSSVVGTQLPPAQFQFSDDTLTAGAGRGFINPGTANAVGAAGISPI